MIDEHGFGEIIGRQNPLFSASRHRHRSFFSFFSFFFPLFPRFSPLTKSGRQIVWFFWGFSRILGASVPCSLLLTIASTWIPASPRIFASPLFPSPPLYHYSGGVLLFAFLSLYSSTRVHSLWSPSYTLPYLFLLSYPSNSTGYCWKLLFVSRHGYLAASCMVMLWGLIGLTPYFVFFCLLRCIAWVLLLDLLDLDLLRMSEIVFSREILLFYYRIYPHLIWASFTFIKWYTI